MSSGHIDITSEHRLYYDIYYNELKVFYQKTAIFTAIQSALFSGIILKFDELKSNSFMMGACLIFLLLFSVLQLLVAIRGYTSNNSIVATIDKFEKEHHFSFLANYEAEVKRQKKITKMNFPSLAIVFISCLFLLLWGGILIAFLAPYLKGWAIAVFQYIRLPFSSQRHLLSAPLKLILSAVISIALAVTMKISDMLNEHGLKLFQHADIVFGILWGICGAGLVRIDTALANAMLAMMIGYVVRQRLDFKNHIIAFIIVTVSFILWGTILKVALLSFIAAFTCLGLVKDLKYFSCSDRLSLWLKKVYLYIPLIYALPGLGYSIQSNNWIVFTALFLFDFTYNLVRIISRRKAWYRDESTGNEVSV